MKILVLCHRPPYSPQRGGKIRPFNMIRHLAVSHEVAVATLARTADEPAAFVHSPIHVIPNGVDLEYFEPTRPSGRGYVPNRIVFTGNMSYRPNVDAVQHLVTAVLPRIRREIPDVQLCIVGMDPSPAVRRLADEDRVVVTGGVDDVRLYFGSAAVAVAPLRVARGLRLPLETGQPRRPQGGAAAGGVPPAARARERGAGAAAREVHPLLSAARAEQRALPCVTR
jgi:glycosyltransferase involved in cell wall biosynthesis